MRSPVRRHRPSGPHDARLRGWLALCCTVGLSACVAGGSDAEGAGPTRWTDGRATTRTQAVTVPSEQLESLRGRIPRKIDHRDRGFERSRYVTVVLVQPEWHEAPARADTTLLTELELPDGRRTRHTWSADARSRVWVAVFGVPEPPVRAATAVVR